MHGLSKTLLLVLPATALASSTPHSNAKQGSFRMCYGSSDASCNLLFHECVSSASLWSSPSCLAAATCSGLEHFLEALCCSTGHCIDPVNEPNLDYKLYANIVGTCAQGSGECSATLKDYIKFYYNTLIDAGSFKLPPVKTVIGWWNAIASWSGGIGTECSYSHLNDWLHHSSPAVHPQQSHLTQAATGSKTSHPASATAEQHDTPPATHSEPADAHDAPGSDQDLMKHALLLPHGNSTSLSLVKRASSTAAASATPSLPVYHVPCMDYPEVCENWCYYVFCKKRGTNANDRNWIVTVDRNAKKRLVSDCGKNPNKCSKTRDPKDNWPRNPISDLTCDEQPKNTHLEGGPGAATRCIPQGQNSGEGATWRNFLNKPGAKILDGTRVRVVLDAPPRQGFCASLYVPGSTRCVAPVTPTSPAVTGGTEDGRRQA